MTPVRGRLAWLAAVNVAMLAAVGGWLLARLDALGTPLTLLVALAIVIAGELVTALLIERGTQPRVLTGPGDAGVEHAVVVGGFDAGPDGVVRVAGERWRARAEGTERPVPGTRVRVVGRDGLVLRVRT